MFINFQSNEAVHANLLQAALNSFDGKDFKLTAKGNVLNISQILKIFSPFLRNIVDSIPLVDEVPTIILPDCSSTSITHLVNILTTSSTNIPVSRATPGEEKKSILEVAKVLGINLRNLVVEKVSEAVIDMKVKLEYFETENVKAEKLTNVEDLYYDQNVVSASKNINQETKKLHRETKSEEMTDDTVKNVAVFTNEGFPPTLNITSINVPSYKCPECNRVFRTECRDAFFSHIKTHDRKIFACMLCGQGFFNNVSNHMKSDHGFLKEDFDRFHKLKYLRNKLHSIKRLEVKLNSGQILQSENAKKVASKKDVIEEFLALQKIFDADIRSRVPN